MRWRFPTSIRIHSAVAFALLAGFWFPADCLASDDEFASSVAPILARRCLGCHNQEQRKGDLSLSNPSELLTDGWIVEGDPGASRFWEVLQASGGKAEMPKDSAPLADDELAALKRWIERGAKVSASFRLEALPAADLNWWSLQPIRSPNVPDGKHPVDWFIDRATQERGLHPLAPAEPGVLIRRLHYDLTGLPPSPRAVAQFVEQYVREPDQTWGRWVDQLLDQPEFGEKWAQHWLDIARYAETHGYDKDKPRINAWPYRDYVIAAFNSDKAYSEFVREQIAGDVLAKDLSEGIVATGFLAAGPWDLIGHIEVGEKKLDGRIAKHLDRDEMASAVFNVFQSTTIQCAQCHDHKFDPISAKDYYRVQAVFAATDRADRVYAGLSQQQASRKLRLENERRDLREKIAEADKQLADAISNASGDIDSRLKELHAMKKSEAPSRHGYHSKIVAKPANEMWVQIDLGRPVLLRGIELIACYDTFNNIGEGFGFPVRFRVEVCEGDCFEPDSARSLFDQTAEDFVNPRSRPVTISADESPIRFIRLTATKLAERKKDYILAIGELRAIDEHGENHAIGAAVDHSDSIPPNARWSPRFLVDDAYYHQSLADPLFDELLELETKRAAIEARVREQLPQPEREAWQKRVAEIDESLKKIPAGQLVYATAVDFKPQGQFKPTGGALRPIHFLHRGDLKAPGERMLPGAPRMWVEADVDFCQTIDHKESEARARLAHYLTDQNNPLVWRSIANRVWQWTFGKPIVATPNDFGRMGSPPTHPELLDYLASSIREDPAQSIKSLVRRLVTSRAYRRASMDRDGRGRSAENLRLDANNAYYWRFDRRRLTAEEIRDSVLTAGGALQREPRGGPSFQDFVIDRPQHSPHYEYEKHDPNDESSHRRSIYRFVVRSQPQPMMMTLDCADPSISVPRRDESTTALQALTQWNHRLIEAMSSRFAQRFKDSAADSAWLDNACLEAWGRLPSDSERVVLLSLDDQHGKETVCRVLLNANAFVYLD